MVVEWKSILFVVVLLAISLLVIKIIESKAKVGGELKRKAFHVAMGLVMLTFPYIFKSAFSVGLLGIIALVILFILKNTKLKNSLGTVLYSVNRESMGEVFFVISVFLIFLFSKGNKVLYSIPILILTLADSSAALIGKSYGRKNLAEQNEDAKSIEGSFTFFVVAFMATLVPLLLHTTVGREETLIISTIIGFNVALIEMISHTGNDNLLIPLTTYAFLAKLVNIDVIVLRQNLVILGVIFILVTIVNRVKTWSKLALVEIAVVGYLTVLLYGFYAIIPPLLVLLTSMRFPKLQESEKNIVFDSRIIETNILVGLVIAGIATITGYKEYLFMTYVTSYAMNLAVNNFVRFKYYVKVSEFDAVVIAFFKAMVFVFLPGIIIQKIVFNSNFRIGTLVAMSIFVMISCIMILIKKRNVEVEETTIKNGYMHMRIVGMLTAILAAMQFFMLNGVVTWKGF